MDEADEATVEGGSVDRHFRCSHRTAAVVIATAVVIRRDGCGRVAADEVAGGEGRTWTAVAMLLRMLLRPDRFRDRCCGRGCGGGG